MQPGTEAGNNWQTGDTLVTIAGAPKYRRLLGLLSLKRQEVIIFVTVSQLAGRAPHPQNFTRRHWLACPYSHDPIAFASVRSRLGFLWLLPPASLVCPPRGLAGAIQVAASWDGPFCARLVAGAAGFSCSVECDCLIGLTARRLLLVLARYTTTYLLYRQAGTRLWLSFEVFRSRQRAGISCGQTH